MIGEDKLGNGEKKPVQSFQKYIYKKWITIL